MSATDTYPRPRHGWTCFHCGDHFPANCEEAAREHFGPTPSWTPACIERRTLGRDRLLELSREARASEHEAVQARIRAEENEEVAVGHLQACLRLVPGATSSHDLWAHIDSLNGRVITAEAVIAEARKVAPAAIELATVFACGDQEPHDEFQETPR